MVLDLSSITFTEQDDIVPESGEEIIINESITNTLAGNDIIFGSNDNYYINSLVNYGLKNWAELNTGDGNDIISGNTADNASLLYNYGNYGLVNYGTLNAGAGNDLIFGSGNFILRGGYFEGIYNSGILNA